MAEPKTPAADVKDILVAGSHGTFAATSGWSLRVGGMNDQPDTQISITDTGGLFDNPKWRLEEPTFQVQVRAAPGDYESAYSKIYQVKDELEGRGRSTESGTVYTGMIVTSPPTFIQWDENNRPLFSMRLRAWREPSSTASNRLPLS